MRAATVAVLAVAVAACGSDSRPADSRRPDPSPIDAPAQPDVTALPACSATDADIPPLGDQPDLPAAVDDLRTELYDAAVACDFDELASIAADSGDEFSYTFGAPTAGGPAALWRSIDSRDAVMEQLARALTAPHARSGSGDDAAFIWPSASRAQPTDVDWRALVEAGIATSDDLDTLRSFGTYLGYRTAILPDGRWQFLVAGD